MFPNEFFKSKIEEKNSSIGALALAIDLDRSTLSRRFSRNTPWNIENFIDACEFFGINPIKLMEIHIKNNKLGYTNEN